MNEKDWIFDFIDRSRRRFTELTSVERQVPERLTDLLDRLDKSDASKAGERYVGKKK